MTMFFGIEDYWTGYNSKGPESSVSGPCMGRFVVLLHDDFFGFVACGHDIDAC